MLQNTNLLNFFYLVVIDNLEINVISQKHFININNKKQLKRLKILHY